MRRRFIGRLGDRIPRRVPIFRVWLAGLEGTVDPAAILNGLERFVEACNGLDSSLLDVILKRFNS